MPGKLQFARFWLLAGNLLKINRVCLTLQGKQLIIKYQLLDERQTFGELAITTMSLTTAQYLRPSGKISGNTNECDDSGIIH